LYASDIFCSQLCAPNVISIRRSPIRYPAPRAHPRSTGDALGTPDTLRSEMSSGGTDASAIHERTLNHRLPSNGAVAGKGNRRSGNHVDRRANHRNGARTPRKSICRSLRYLCRHSSALNKTPRSIRPLRMRFPIYNWPMPFISPLLFHNEQPLSATRHRQRGEATGMAPLVG
jgi:hypothetical protein